MNISASSARAYARTLLFFAIGGALGTLLRAGLVAVLPQAPLPWDTLFVNLLGSFLIGPVMELGEKLHAHIHAFHAIGFCGGLTTFSAFAVETARLAHSGHTGLAAAYAAMSVLGCVLAVWAGFRATGLWTGRLTKGAA